MRRNEHERVRVRFYDGKEFLGEAEISCVMPKSSTSDPGWELPGLIVMCWDDAAKDPGFFTFAPLFGESEMPCYVRVQRAHVAERDLAIPDPRDAVDVSDREAVTDWAKTTQRRLRELEDLVAALKPVPESKRDSAFGRWTDRLMRGGWVDPPPLQIPLTTGRPQAWKHACPAAIGHRVSLRIMHDGARPVCRDCAGLFVRYPEGTAWAMYPGPLGLAAKHKDDAFAGIRFGQSEGGGVLTADLLDKVRPLLARFGREVPHA